MIQEFLIFGTIVVLALLAAIATHKFLLTRTFNARYRMHERNPYRRYCLACGQQQDAHGDSMNSRNYWWEQAYEICNKECQCHKDCKNYAKFCKLFEPPT